MTPTASSAIAAFCIFNRRLPCRRRPQPQSIFHVTVLQFSQSSDDSLLGVTPSPPDKDWFMDGREAARKLKMELGIATEDGDGNPDSQSKEHSVGNELSASNAILESGRAAARELLKAMNDEDQSMVSSLADNPDPDAEAKKGDLRTPDAHGTLLGSSKQPSDNPQCHDYFSVPSRKSHCMTICLVPPPSETKAWEQLTEVRKECRDPGFFRWPPHSNILYPFLEPLFDKDCDKSKDAQRANFRNEMALHLGKVARQCEPFEVTIDSFGTFGGKNRGVLWAYPKSRHAEVEEGSQPLITLHSLLEKQFPMCKDQRKCGAFHPHITVSHYANNNDALAAKKEVESMWQPISFHVPEIYLLERIGDDGQFKVAATIKLGSDSKVELHNPPMAFPAMPEVEEQWVYDERMEMKNRRKKGNKWRRRGGKSKEKNDASPSKETGKNE